MKQIIDFFTDIRLNRPTYDAASNMIWYNYDNHIYVLKEGKEDPSSITIRKIMKGDFKTVDYNIGCV